MNRGSKNDQHAKQHWGHVYDAIPKSVFATIAWHLANLASDKADTEGAAEMRFLEELKALVDGDIIPKSQGLSVVRAYEAAIAKVEGR